MISNPRKLVRKNDQSARKILGALVVLCVLFMSLRADELGSSPAGLVITNRADATYSDSDGNDYSTVSGTVRVTVMAVPAIAVTPDETAPSEVVAANDRVLRTFRLCNAGNVADFYLLRSATVSNPAEIVGLWLDLDESGTITPSDAPITLGQTLTPRLAPRECLNVLADVSTGAVSGGSIIRLTFEASATLTPPGANEPPVDSGVILNSVGRGVVFNSPTNAKLPPELLVQNVTRATVASGQTLNYKLSFINTGAVTARNVRVLDELATALDYQPGTLRLNGRTLSDAADADEGTVNGRHISLLLPSLAPNATAQIEFQARLAAILPNGTGIENKASVIADNAVATESNAAVVVMNPSGVVFAGSSGGAVRIPGARLTLLSDAQGAPVTLISSVGLPPNGANENPFTATPNGEYSFVTEATPVSGGGLSATSYVLRVTAPNFRDRLIALESQPVGGLRRLTLRALDGQALATSGGFTLTSEAVMVENVAALAFNIPLFETSTLEISKFADRQFAEIGDLVTYQIQLRNAAASPLTAVQIQDQLPDGFVYADGTAGVDGRLRREPITPIVSGRSLKFDLGTMSAGDAVTISYRVRIGASAAEGEQFNVATATGRQPNGDMVGTAQTRAGVRVRGGVFGLTQVIVGRVFVDADKNGRFDNGEKPLAGVRIYLNNGKSVITDDNGQYSFPIVDSGSMVVALDPVTLPSGFVLLDDNGRESSKSWTRLLRTPLGGGSLLRQNFAVATNGQTPSVNSSTDQFVTTSAPARQQDATEKPKSDSASGVVPTTPNRAPGTYTVENTTTIAPVAPGEVFLVSPANSTVLMTPALQIEARVAKGWTLEAAVNGELITGQNLAETRVDNRNSITVFSYVGIPVKPGPNQVRLTAVGGPGERGKTIEFSVFGRGPAERLEITEEKNATPLPGQLVRLRIRGFDQLGNPAADGPVSLQTSAGRIRLTGGKAGGEDDRQLTVQLEGGAALVELSGEASLGTVRVKAVTGTAEANADVRFSAELRPTLLVGLAELSIGGNAPEIANSNDQRNFLARLAVFYRGRFLGPNLLTLSYDSNRPLNRFGGRDRFGASDALERAYPILGDASQRFDETPSNSKLYARLDRGLSYVMFGDMEADMDRAVLTGYNRRLTGVKLRYEGRNGDFVTLTGARPDTAFARDVFPAGGISLMRLAHRDILPGSEVVTLEVRDRRRPEIILNRETLIRAVDYNLDPQTGEFFLIRPIAAFDADFNLRQLTVVYEHRADGTANFVYTGRLNKGLAPLGMRFGASYVNQRQRELGAFQMGGIDFDANLWKGGKFSFEAAFSNGRFASGVNVFDFFNGAGGFVTEDLSRPRNGLAFMARIDQPLPFRSRLRAEYMRADEDFLNPFGGTIVGGNERFNSSLEFRTGGRRTMSFGFMSERNRTFNVNNSRLTFSALWAEQWRENLRTSVGFDHRVLDDAATPDRQINSNLITAGVEYRPTAKVEIAVKREQNLGEADPTFPDQTTFGVRYELDKNTKLFLTQRLAAAPITPIGDFAGNGFAGTRARNELAVGIESRLSGIGAINGRYQIENGINGRDSFAVVGLQNRWNLTKKVGLEAGFERGFLLDGNGESFNSATLGFTFTPVEGFQTNARYELRDRNGFGQLLSVGAVGRIGDNWSTLARGQWTVGNFAGRRNSASNVTAATAFRPLRSDSYALLFSYNRREMFQQGAELNGGLIQPDLRDVFDTVSSDGLYSPYGSLELYGRFALRFAGNGNSNAEYASALTLLVQIRAQQKFARYFDVAGEGRWLTQPSSATFRRSFGAEFGVWALPDFRLGLGYNFTRRGFGFEPYGRPVRQGVYFTVTTKLSNLFNLFGTPNKGLTNSEPVPPQPVRVADGSPEDEEIEDEK